MATNDGTLAQERLTRSAIGAFYEVYNALGFGFLESVYSAAMEMVLKQRGHRVAREVPVTAYLLGTAIARQRIDMIVDECLVIENKTASKYPLGAERQLYNYLRATDLELGLLFNFGMEPKFGRRISTNPTRR
jgi:GxxExxY protein